MACNNPHNSPRECLLKCAIVERTACCVVGMAVGGKMTPIGVCVNIVLSAISEFHIGYYIVNAITLPMEYGLDHIVYLVTWTCSVFRAVVRQISAPETIFLRGLDGNGNNGQKKNFIATDDKEEQARNSLLRH